MAARRTSFLFPKDAAAELAAIRQQSCVDDDSDAIRLALSVLEALIEIAGSGSKIFIRDGNGKLWPYSPFRRFTYDGLARAAQNAPPPPAAEPKNFFFSGEAVERMDLIRERTDLSTHSDVIRFALLTLNQLLTIDSLGDEVVVRDRADRDEIFNVFDPRARRQALNRAKELVPA